jgi:glycosyltransferase involved in cell wall biosynthesis
VVGLDMSARRILTVSTGDAGGGAERVARELHEHYLGAGHDAWLAVGRLRRGGTRTIEVPNEAERGVWARGWNAVTRAMPGGAAGFHLRRILGAVAEPARWARRRRGEEDFDFPGTQAIFGAIGGAPAAIHLHNLHGDFFDLRALPEWSARIPTVVSMHDAWLLSGHCAHPLGCERWSQGCGSCPALWIYPAQPRDDTAANWERKRAIFARSALHIGVPCEWLAARVRASILAPAVRSIRVIPYGVDLGLYTPVPDRGALRRDLGLDPERPVFVVFSTAIEDRTWKDGATFRRALALLNEGRHAQWIVLGRNGGEVTVGGVRMRAIPHLREDRELARWFQAADAYVHPARADTFPLVNLEAQACGAAIIATAVDGIPEQVVAAPASAVRDGSFSRDATGILVAGSRADALAAAIDAIAGTDPVMRMRLGAQAASHAARNFDRDRHCREYESWLLHLAGTAA